MTSIRISTGLFLFVACLMMPTAFTTAHEPTVQQSKPAKLGKLGVVHLPTSAQSDEAQANFLHGVAALHSFWYPVALDEFRAATKIDPNFMMGYWGEAMTYNHPLWGDPQETEVARKALAKIRITPKLTQREKAYLNAVKVLYEEGEKVTRDKIGRASCRERV